MARRIRNVLVQLAHSFMLHSMQYSHRRKAYSLVEVVVASVIFAGSSMFAFAAIGKLKQTEGYSACKLNASLMAKKILDGLSKDVNALTWDSGNLSIGHHAGLTDIDFPGYTADYDVSDAAGARKVDITVNWTPTF